MTQEEKDFIQANEAHFDLVLKHNQQFQAGHDLTKQVLKIAEGLPGGKSFDQCDCTIPEVYAKVWEAYQDGN